MVRVTDLFVYPVKSCRGIRLDEAELDAFGFRHDRRWMVVDADGEALTRRVHPRFALVRVALTRDGLELSAPDLPDLRVPYDGVRGAATLVQVWDDRCEAIDQGDAAGDWLSRHLGLAARLVYMPESSLRPIEPNAAGVTGRVSFTDGYPFLVISAEALDGLNARLERPLPMNRFRPNIVVEGAGPHAEDGWRAVRIGDVPFTIAKACARCVLTTVDQETAEKGREPLRTLATYRKGEKGVLFGQNAVHHAAGRLRVGDPVVVERVGDPVLVEAS